MQQGRRGQGGAQTTLRITVQEEAQVTRLKLEGRLAGPYAAELVRTWQSLAPSLDSKRLVVDLCGVSHVDTPGKELLAEIRSESGAEFVGKSALTNYIAEEARQSNHGRGKQGG